MDYKIIRFDGDLLEIPGLDNRDAFGDDKTEKLICGLNHSLDSLESWLSAIYSHLYEIYQCNDIVRDGDTFTIEPFSYANSYRKNQAPIEIPAWQFAASGIHIIPVKNSTPEFERLWAAIN